MRRLLVAAAGLAVAFGATMVATFVARADSPADATPIEAKYFNHELHAGMDKPAVIMTGDKANCASCHAVDKSSKIAMPGQNAHQPCINSGCHDTWFLSAGIPGDKKYKDAVGFCLGCHDTGHLAPKPSQKAPPIFLTFKAEMEFHVEMPGPDDPDTAGTGSHFEHSKIKGGRQDCRSCHIVQEDGLLKPQTPGHDQCLVCHSAEDKKKGSVKVSMEQCDKCHKSGPREDPFKTQTRHTGDAVADLQASKPDHATSVRSCGSEAWFHLLSLAKPAVQKMSREDQEKQIPCFKHERPGHRFKDPKAKSGPVECSECHYMIGDDKGWPNLSKQVGHKVQYYSLKDIHENPIITNNQNEEHNACGADGSGKKGCHELDIPLRGSGKCELCHAGNSAATSAF